MANVLELQNPSLREGVVDFLEPLLPDVAHPPIDKSAAPTVGAQSQDRLAQGSGIRTQPGGDYGAAVPSPALDRLSGNVIAGPYTLGQMVSKMDFRKLDSMLLLGSAVNVAVTGWVINMIAQRPGGPLDSFGLMVSGLGQASVGLFFTGMPATQVRK